MSENKRFEIMVISEEHWQIIDNKTGEYANPVDGTVNVLQGLVSSMNMFYDETIDLKKENEQLKQQVKSKERLIEAHEQYINDLKEDGVLDD